MNYTLKVAVVRKETDDAVTLCFKQPALKKIKYQAGQYLTLIFNINGRRYIRPYSFSSCPGVDQYLEITVKRVLNGVVSNHINDSVKEGDTIEVMSPMGEFTFSNELGYKVVYLWGVGSGITPLLSIAKQILHTEQGINVCLVYGNRNYESTILLDQILQLQEKFSQRFTVIHFHTKNVVSADNPLVVEGRIDHKKATGILNKNQFINLSGHFICGPAGLKESVKTAVANLKVDEKHVFSEDFELVKNPKDFESIITRNIVINFNGEDHQLEVVKGKSILEVALDANIALPYSCQTGNCSICKGHLISGEVSMIGLVKSRADLSADECLVCCSHPVSENVYIEIK